MRLVAGIALIVEGVAAFRGASSVGVAVLHLIGAGAGILLIAGLWTPIAGVLVAILALWQGLSEPGSPRSSILLGTLGVALAMLGPGGWSVDARLFGWKRIDVRDRKN